MTSIVGHDAAQAALRTAWDSGRMPHAWMLSGPAGIGKATLAARFAAFVLCGGQGGAGLFGVGDDPLPVPADHPALALIAAGSHPDLRILKREPNERGALRKEITVEQVRQLAPFFGIAADGWRVVIIDALEEMNRAAANALLKMLEEPPARTLFLGVSHAPGRLLPTIRSRVRALALKPLRDDQVAQVLAQHGQPGTLAALAEGSPGQALRYAGLDVAALEQSLDRLAGPDADAALHQLATSLGGAAAQARFEAFLDLACRRIALACTSLRGPALAEGLALWEKARALAGEAAPLALDARLVVLELGGGLRDLAALSKRSA